MIVFGDFTIMFVYPHTYISLLENKDRGGYTSTISINGEKDSIHKKERFGAILWLTEYLSDIKYADRPFGIRGDRDWLRCIDCKQNEWHIRKEYRMQVIKKTYTKVSWNGDTYHYCDHKALNHRQMTVTVNDKYINGSPDRDIKTNRGAGDYWNKNMSYHKLSTDEQETFAQVINETSVNQSYECVDAIDYYSGEEFYDILDEQLINDENPATSIIEWLTNNQNSEI